jgi:hypothetical protein
LYYSPFKNSIETIVISLGTLNSNIKYLGDFKTKYIKKLGMNQRSMWVQLMKKSKVKILCYCSFKLAPILYGSESGPPTTYI